MSDLKRVAALGDRVRVTVTMFLALGLALWSGSTAVNAEAGEIVERGAYLARAADCLPCHTAKGGDPYAGGFGIETPFGTVYGPNITPDTATGIGTWTEADFYRAIHEGVGKHGDLYPVFPYTFYTKMPREDVMAIYRYLQTVKPVHQPSKPPELSFPFNLRFLQLGWRELYFHPGAYRPDPSKSAEWNRGAYLVEGPGHCGACHTPRTVLGGLEKHKQFSGAEVDHWFALNITSDLRSGIGGWSIDQIVAYLKSGAAKGKGTTFGGMAVVVHDSLAYLTDADLRAMAVYLKTVRPIDTAGAGEVDATAAARKQTSGALYVDKCAACHQAKGTGVPGVFPPLKGNDAVTAENPGDLLRVILAGLPGQGTYPAMPGNASTMSDQQIADLANYVRTSWGNTAPANVTAAAVATLRRVVTGSR